MIVIDRWSTPTITSSALALSLLFAAPAAALADVPAAAAPAAAASALDAAPAPAAPGEAAAVPAAPHAVAVPNVDLKLICNGRVTLVSTPGESVGEFLTQRGLHLTQNDFVSAPLDEPLATGMILEVRTTKTVTLAVDGRKRVLHTSAATIADVLQEAHVTVGNRDDVSPAPGDAVYPDDVIRVDRNAITIVHRTTSIPAKLRMHDDAHLPLGTIRVVAAGSPGLRVTTTRVVRRPGGAIVRTTLGSKIVRLPHARVIARGIAEYTTLASMAERGFKSAIRFAGNALHVIATAYTAGCYGCSGITANGMHAGFGVIAVDPAVIPLGTRLFIPGYGRAIAGDTGGAIHGRRVDLGMNTVAEALRFGRRPMTVYILR